MSKSDQYSANARECLRMGQKASSPDQKRSWFWLAQAWLAMLADVEKDDTSLPRSVAELYEGCPQGSLRRRSPVSA